MSKLYHLPEVAGITTFTATIRLDRVAAVFISNSRHIKRHTSAETRLKPWWRRWLSTEKNETAEVETETRVTRYALNVGDRMGEPGTEYRPLVIAEGEDLKAMRTAYDALVAALEAS